MIEATHTKAGFLLWRTASYLASARQRAGKTGRNEMSSNAIFFAWNRSLPGREVIGSEHFNDFVAYLGALQKAGSIQSFEPVFLNPHGGDMNGFFLIRGDSAKLDAVMASVDWVRHMVRATMHLEGAGAVRAVTGDELMQRMELWRSLIPR
jgi:hypothetical protein